MAAEALSEADEIIARLQAQVAALEQAQDEARREVGEMGLELAEARKANATAPCLEEDLEESGRDCFNEANRQLGVFKLAEVDLHEVQRLMSGISSPASPRTPPSGERAILTDFILLVHNKRMEGQATVT